MSKFFSICIPGSNRIDTIYNSLVSVALQKFRDFECIITFNDPTDPTIQVVKDFFTTSIYLENKFYYIIKDQIDIESYNDLDDWNEPLKLASGKYIAMLEGDDEFSSLHLQKAYEIISQNKNIGIYSVANQVKQVGSVFGFIESKKAKNLVFSLELIPPPSQVIFVKSNKFGKDYYFNTNDFVYAPEIELYYLIICDGYNVFNNEEAFVTRHISTNRNKGVGWYYFKDKDMFLKKYRSNIISRQYLKSEFRLRILLLKSFKKSLLKNHKVDILLLYKIINLDPLKYLFKKKFAKHFFVAQLIFNFHKERFISRLEIIKYFYLSISNIIDNKRGLFPNKKYINFINKIYVEKIEDFWKASYNNIDIFFPIEYDSDGIKRNLNSILNEQSYEYSNYSPHQYRHISKLSSEDIVYDIGAAEGYQSKIWIEKVKKIYIFEPDPIILESLQKTFEIEIKDRKVFIIPYGVSNFSASSIVFEKEYKFDTLDNLIHKFNIPYPNIIKADVEGHEIKLLEGAKQVLASKEIKTIQITTYHKPNDYIDIPKFLEQYRGKGYFSDGIMYFNRNMNMETGNLSYDTFDKLYQPVFRKCLYTFDFIHD